MKPSKWQYVSSAGKIQALKKSATKGDKKRKKEVTEEITKLEAELEKKHAEELANAEVGKKDVSGNREFKSLFE